MGHHISSTSQDIALARCIIIFFMLIEGRIICMMLIYSSVLICWNGPSLIFSFSCVFFLSAVWLLVCLLVYFNMLAYVFHVFPLVGNYHNTVFIFLKKDRAVLFFPKKTHSNGQVSCSQSDQLVFLPTRLCDMMSCPATVALVTWTDNVSPRLALAKYICMTSGSMMSVTLREVTELIVALWIVIIVLSNVVAI